MNAGPALPAPFRAPSRAPPAPAALVSAAAGVRPLNASAASTTAPLALHVERLVLQGLPLRPRDGARVEAAFRGEVERLVSARPRLAQRLAGGAFDSLRLDAIQVGGGGGSECDPEQLGRALAGALLRGMAR